MKIKKQFFFIAAVATFFLSTNARAAEDGRYFFEGDGRLHLVNSKTGAGGEIRYRTEQGVYSEADHQKINRIFGVPQNSSEEIALRLIALLDYVQEKLHGGTIRIVSGYRSPTYNEGLRKKGRLAAKTSTHIEGMAGDINLDGVDGKKLWEFVRDLDCCGAGYYHGKGIHIDVGPSRFWDETSTKVEQDLGGHNKLLLLRTDFDRYHPGETAHLAVSRITDYPVGIRFKGHKECRHLETRAQARSLTWEIPGNTKNGKTQIEFEVCDKNFPEMPDQIVSNVIEVQD